ncbi:hypothetical protein J8273_0138 [Carpediemonas membranifera]|uniref:Uncharacterized protein n=1 Tax=Carpediemonas membranifera TaxID=201153 RepID=A0A8J6EAM9_9EUKA|nr:hypothetical protein J8273_0138 [Carpediemonas membranifera]|eukprot:KAG9394930.1 hypothetical protein J8273_0138 [Carpediemonas membranifera]
MSAVSLTSPERPFQPDHWAQNLRSGHEDLRSSSIGLQEPSSPSIGKLNNEDDLERRNRLLNILSELKAEEMNPDVMYADEAPNTPTGPKTWKEYALALKGEAHASHEEHVDEELPPAILPEPGETYPCLDVQYYVEEGKTDQLYLAVRDAVLSRLPERLIPVYQALRPADATPPEVPSFMQQTKSGAAKTRPDVPPRPKKKVPAKINPHAPYLQPTVASLTRTESTVHENLRRQAQQSMVKERTPKLSHTQRLSEAEQPRPGKARTADSGGQWASLFVGIPPPPPAGPDATPQEARLAMLRRKFFQLQLREYASQLLKEVEGMTLDKDPSQC